MQIQQLHTYISVSIRYAMTSRDLSIFLHPAIQCIFCCVMCAPYIKHLIPFSFKFHDLTLISSFLWTESLYNICQNSVPSCICVHYMSISSSTPLCMYSVCQNPVPLHYFHTLYVRMQFLSNFYLQCVSEPNFFPVCSHKSCYIHIIFPDIC